MAIDFRKCMTWRDVSFRGPTPAIRELREELVAFLSHVYGTRITYEPGPKSRSLVRWNYEAGNGMAELSMSRPGYTIKGATKPESSQAGNSDLVLCLSANASQPLGSTIAHTEFQRVLDRAQKVGINLTKYLVPDVREAA